MKHAYKTRQKYTVFQI